MDEATGKQIAKNTFWLFIGQITGRALRAAIVIYAARILGAASWGAFSYAISLAALLTIFSDVGVNALITREGSRFPELRQKYLATAFFIKTVLLIILMGGVIIFGRYLTNLEEAIALMPVVVFIFAFDSLRDLGSGMARALEKMQIESLITIFTNASIFILGFVFLYLVPTSKSLARAYAAGTGLGLAAVVFSLRPYFKGLTRNFDRNLVKPIIISAWPFGLMGLMGAVMINTDVLMLGWLAGAREVGLYSAGQRIVQLLYIVPTLIAAAFFPELSRLASTSSEKFKNLLEQALKVLY
ncbi:MAG: flippase, partial [Candidatus Colwellbacteria bacterium]|nr:flippase [Candidatus Colwellbacteria bacterium]